MDENKTHTPNSRLVMIDRACPKAVVKYLSIGIEQRVFLFLGIFTLIVNKRK